jgi:hypothetical protein
MTTGPIGRLILSGVIDATQSWSVGLTCQAETGPTSDELDAWLTAVESLVDTWWVASGGVGSINKPSLLLTTLTAYGYVELNTPPTGVAQHVLGTALAGTGTTVVTPSQLAVVCTLKTPYPGRHNTGRIYLPATAMPLLSTNRVTAALCNTLATTCAAFLTSLAGETINGTTTSAVLVPSSGISSSRFVSEASVGDIVDTQRRRRDKYVETRHAHTV